MALSASTDISASPLQSDEALKKIAEKHNVSVSTVLISWQVNRGVVVLPKSVTPSRITDNLKAIKLDAEDMKVLDTLAEGGKAQRLIHPPWGSDLGFKDWYGAGNKDAPEGTRFLAGKA